MPAPRAPTPRLEVKKGCGLNSAAESGEGRSRTPLLVVRAAACLLIFAALAALAAALASRSPQLKEKEPAALRKTLLVEPVELRPRRAEAAGYGTVRPNKTVTVSSELKGKVARVRPGMKDGALAGQGETLVEIQADDYTLALREAAAEAANLTAQLAMKRQDILDTQRVLETVKQRLVLEKKDYLRKRTLFDKGAVPQADLDTAAQNLETSKNLVYVTDGALSQLRLSLDSLAAQIERAAAAKAVAELNISRATIRCPFNGRLEAVSVEAGEYVNPGDKLFEVKDDSSLELPVDLDAAAAMRLMRFNPDPGVDRQRWFSVPEDVEATASWSEAPGKCRWQGKIIRVEAFDAQTRTLTVVVRPERYAGDCATPFPLVDGMFCKVDFHGERLAPMASIPWVALQLDGDAFVVGEDGKVARRSINVFSSEGDELLVDSGLADGELLVAQKLPRGVVDGMAVNTVRSRGAAKPDEAKAAAARPTMGVGPGKG